MDLAPYDYRQQGWTRRANLLWRTQFGASEAEITRAIGDTFERVVRVA